MNLHRSQNHDMGLTDFLTWRSNAAAATLPLVADEDLAADVDEPPDSHISQKSAQASFTKSSIPMTSSHKESLLTKAFQSGGEPENDKPDVQVTTDLTRRRSMMSNASLASTAELTSDGGLTSPARTNTPSPPIPRATYTSFAPYSITAKTSPRDPATVKTEARNNHELPSVVKMSPKPQSPVAAAPRKRYITFMCDGNKGTSSKHGVTNSPSSQDGPTPTAIVAPQPQQPRKCTIKFACPGPKPLDKLVKVEATTPPQSKSTDALKRSNRSPSIPRKSPRPGSASRIHRESTGSVRRASQSPVAVRAKPKYIIADEKTIQSSEATRFHEFASEELQEDDWIRKDIEVPKTKLTINDTLKMENAIRRLGNEAEEEAMEEDEEEEEEVNDSEDGDGFDEDEDENDDEEEEEEDFENSEDDASDGNETDNEAGFAESDDESDGGGEFAFWTPGRRLRGNGEASTYRPSAHRAASVSSIDSLNHMELSNGRKKIRRRPIKIRPGTPDLPDSTDFVCGTLDEDRPLEDAYVSCMEVRKHAKHKLTPQDIDPSFPTSDLEEEDDNDVDNAAHDSDEHVWIHGKFEESDDERFGRRRTNNRRKSPQHSPRRIHSPAPLRRLHSPPPTKHRLRSPPPRKLFGNSPKRMRSPPPARMIQSPPASPEASSHAINFAPLGSRPGLTHTKSLPRTPNAFCRAYHAARLAAANGNDGSESNDGHVRGAIDIVKGLEQRRQRRKEKFLQNRKNKCHTERRPQPGKGAERMRELGLLMAGKTGATDPYMMSA